MANSLCSSSNKRHLGPIWVAAYFFKKLKKFQVTATDISASVDNILQDELDVVTYRILAYLLLGLVRIYAKKVEYLFDDCNEILMEINKFVVDVKDKAHIKTIQSSFSDITLPERFELDAFDLDIVEDFHGRNLVSAEEITLKENKWRNESSKPYFFGKHHYVDGGVFNDKFYLDELSAEGPRTLRTQRVFGKILQDNNYVGEKLMDISASYVAGKEPPDQVEVCSIDDHYHGEQSKISVVEDSKHETYPECGQEKHLGFSEEEKKMIETCPRLEIVPSYIVESFSEHPTDETDIVSFASEKLLSVEEANDLSCLNKSIEKLRDNTCPAEECMDLDQFCNAKEESLDPIVNKEYYHINEEQLKSVDTMSEKQELNNSMLKPKLSILPHETSLSKFIDASENITPDYMVVTTPATKECARNSRKRKCIFDDFIILPNKIVKQNINDASDLISKRRKAPHNAFAVWKAGRISNRFNCFVEPMMSCISFELRSLFYDSRQKIVKYGTVSSLGKLDEEDGYPSDAANFSLETDTETVNSSQKLDINETPNDQILAPLETSSLGKLDEEDGYPSDATSFSLETDTETVNSSQKLDINETPNDQILAPLETVEVLENLSGLDPSNIDCCEPLAIAPETPVRQSSSVRPFQSPLERVCAEPFMHKDRELDFSLLDEEPNLCGADEREADGWSGRTRLIGRILHRNFLNQKKQRGDEVIKLFQLLEGSTQKESARMFYEILVLKTKDCMDVKQDYAYGDILLLKLPKLEQIFGNLSV